MSGITREQWDKAVNAIANERPKSPVMVMSRRMKVRLDVGLRSGSYHPVQLSIRERLSRAVRTARKLGASDGWQAWRKRTELRMTDEARREIQWRIAEIDAAGEWRAEA